MKKIDSNFSFINIRILVVLLITFNIFLSGCSAQRPKNENARIGRVVDIKKLENKDLRPGKGTAVGAATGASVGGAIGGLVGAVAGVGVSIATFGLGAPAIPAMVAGGALMGGGVGAASGGVGGYVYDYKKAGSGLYEYTVKCENDENVKIRQISNKPFPVDSTVKVFWYKDKQIIEALKLPQEKTIISFQSNALKYLS